MVKADGCEPEEWNFVCKSADTIDQCVHTAPMFEVLWVDIGDHGDGRIQQHEAPIGFVGLRHQKLASTQSCR